MNSSPILVRRGSEWADVWVSDSSTSLIHHTDKLVKSKVLSFNKYFFFKYLVPKCLKEYFNS